MMSTPSELTVRELLADPGLRLRLEAGRDGIDRPIAAAAVSELTEPGSWLQGGELLLTIGLLLPSGRGQPAGYVAHLREHDVRALGIGLGVDLPFQQAPPALVAAAEEAGLPLLTVPDGVPFIAVTKAVFAHRDRAERRRLEWALSTQRTLTAAAVAPGGLDAILAAHQQATGRTGAVVDLLGRLLAESAPAADLAAELSGLVAGVRGQGLLGAAVDVAGGMRREVHPLGSRRLRAVLLVDGPADGPSASEVTGDLVSLLSLELERRHGLGAAARRGRAQLMARLDRGTVDDVVAARWLATVGLAENDLRAAVVAAGRAPELAADLEAALPDALVRVVAAESDDEDTVEVAAPAAVDLPAVLATLAAGRPGGIGVAVRPGALSVSLRQARSALPVGRVTGEHVHAADVASSAMVLSLVEQDRLRAFADAVLGPLDADPRSAELLRTLSAFLEHNGHWEAAASALGVHRHTVRNRVEAAERASGRRMAAAQDRHELWMALRARGLAGGG